MKNHDSTSPRPPTALMKSTASLANRYDVDAMIHRLGYSRFNVVPAAIFTFNYAVAIVNATVTVFSVYVPPDHEDDVCKGNNQTLNMTEIQSKYPPFTSLMLDFNLICTQPVVSNLATSLFYVGAFSSFFVMVLADRFGRKPILYIGMGLVVVFYALAYFIQNAIVYLAFRVFCGVFYMATSVLSIIILNECFSGTCRVYMFSLMQFRVPLAFALLSFGAYVIQGWRELHLLVSAVSLAMLTLGFFVPESPRWLSAQENVNCQKLLEDMMTKALKVKTLEEFRIAPIELARKNPSHNSTDNTDESVIAADNENKAIASAFSPHKPKSPWRSSEIWKRIFIGCYLVFLGDATFWAINFASADLLPGNRFLNFCVLGLMHIPSLVLVAVSHKFLSHRRTLMMFCSGSAACFLISFAMQFRGWTKEDDAIFSLTVVGRFFAGGAMIVVDLMGVAFFPTTCRSRCYGLCIVAGRLAQAIAPFSSLLVRAVPGAFPAAVGVANVVGVGVAWLTDETLGEKMQQTVEELEATKSAKKDSRNPLQFLKLKT